MSGRSILFVALLSTTVAAAFGCGTPSPEKTCAKAKTLAEKDDKKWSEKDESRCKDQLSDMQKENKDAYECIAKCVAEADSFKAATRGCDQKCEDKIDKKK
jgi:hypothetical protein